MARDKFSNSDQLSAEAQVPDRSILFRVEAADPKRLG
jgi:hypothetical protein